MNYLTLLAPHSRHGDKILGVRLGKFHVSSCGGSGLKGVRQENVLRTYVGFLRFTSWYSGDFDQGCQSVYVCLFFVTDLLCAGK